MRTTVLDHGYVELVEHWGSDERIVEAARMSTDKGFQGWGKREQCEYCGLSASEMANTPAWMECSSSGAAHHMGPYGAPGDEKLLRYLWEHKHATPFEMAGLTIEVQAPIFVFREWHRHRTQCLAPETLIHFSAPFGKRGCHRVTIAELWRRWQPTTRTNRPERQLNALWPRSLVQSMRLRCALEHTGDIGMTRIIDVIRGEIKPMVTIVTTSGKSLTATREHRVFTDSGWMTLGEAISKGASIAAEGFARDLPQRTALPPLDESSEMWQPVADNQAYEVSSQGRVRAAIDIKTQRSDIKRGELINTYGANGGVGYECVSLRDLDRGTTSARLVHSLVMEAFIGPRPANAETRHLNSNAADARLVNLVYGTAAENASDRILSERQQRLHVRYEEIVDYADAGDRQSFDLVVEGPWHNFVANGLVVHNSYNEMSGRYVELPELCYLPSDERIAHAKQASINKQSSQAFEHDLPMVIAATRTAFIETYRVAWSHYQELLQLGVARELAARVLPTAQYSRMRASTDLRNWLGFLTLRIDKSAQWEIRQYANIVGSIIAELFPRTWALFEEGMK